MPSSFLPYAKQSIDESDIEAVKESLLQTRITRGEKTREFEEAIAGYVGAKWAVSFNSASTALEAAAFAASISPLDRYITTPNSYIASVNPGIKAGIKPQFVDIDRASGNMNVDQLAPLVTTTPSRGRLFVVPVHFAGIAIDMRRLDRVLMTPSTIVIEDAAHALGSSYPSGEMVGSCAYSHMTVFSFHPAKNITCGEGGMVTTNDETFFHRLELFRRNGIERQKPYLQGEEALGYYEVHELTSNYHMTEMQAALGLSQLKRLHSFAEKRRSLVRAYRKALEGVHHIRLFSESADERSCYHLMVAQIDCAAIKKSRQQIMQALLQENIGTEVHYVPLYAHPAYKKRFGATEATLFPEEEAYYASALSLPLFVDMQEAEVLRVTEALKKQIVAR